MGDGSFIISLDFELHWGVRDSVSVSQSRDHFLRAREAIPLMLQSFEEHEVHVTWATVGFLFARDKRHLLQHVPKVLPEYANPRLNPYPYLEEIGDDERNDPFHYARSLLGLIADTAGQEVGTHTFSHYYCLEEGQTREAFQADLEAAAAIGEGFGPVASTLVFPRGQHNPAYESAMIRGGVRAYRTQPESFAYHARKGDEENLAHRGFRLLDAYLPVAGSHCARSHADSTGVVPLRAGLFLRPFSPSRRRLEPLRLRRIKNAMESAAKRGRDFHLWWHPHNFGTNTEQNMRVLRETLGHYRDLRERYAWPSRNMGEAAAEATGLA